MFTLQTVIMCEVSNFHKTEIAGSQNFGGWKSSPRFSWISTWAAQIAILNCEKMDA